MTGPTPEGRLPDGLGEVALRSSLYTRTSRYSEHTASLGGAVNTGVRLGQLNPREDTVARKFAQSRSPPLFEGEGHLLKDPDGADPGNGAGRLPPMARDARGGPHQAELIVVAQGRGGDTRASGEFADREELRHPKVQRT
jgi:hypothetical protein